MHAHNIHDAWPEPSISQACDSMMICRWQLAKDSVISATTMHREADAVADVDMRGKDR